MGKLAVWFPEEVVETPVSRPAQSNNDSEIAIVIAAAKRFLAKGGN